jgi:exonuclease III
MSDIKILNWNVRGLNCGARREGVKTLIQQAAPTIICLQETKLDSVDRFLALEFLGQQCMQFEYLPAEHTRGGVLVAWNWDLICAGVTSKKRFSLSVNLTMRMTNASFLLTSVYGPNEDNLKLQFLDELIDCQPVHRMPWVCMGLFRRRTMGLFRRRTMGLFRRALDASELFELRLQNRRYTWSRSSIANPRPS